MLSPTIENAKQRQLALRERRIAARDFESVQAVAGVDLSFSRRTGLARAAAVVLSFPALEIIESSVAVRPIDFPYVPGYLSFREVPVATQALGQLQSSADLLLCDGQGFAHPRRFGLACHLGVEIGLPTIGVAKSRLIGTHREVPAEPGAWVPLLDGDETIGAVLRTRANVQPVFVSVGHRIDLDSAIDFTLQCLTRYRLPETTRAADSLAAWQ
ncbi:MAG: deoxyribonuclease V [Pseudomonadota bacterium]